MIVEDPVAAAKPLTGKGGGFLAWLPSHGAIPSVPAETQPAALKADFESLVIGVQELGCGLEAQLESWYRFLVQPDPYDAVMLSTTDNPPKATLVGVDAVLLQQRHDFLRPDSVVIVVQVTDEEDSWSDPLSLGRHGFFTRTTTWPGAPTGRMPRGTSACDTPIDPLDAGSTGPNDPNCASCGFGGKLPNGNLIADDPNCKLPCGDAGTCFGYYDPKDDNLNVRYVNDMKRRYGIDPQFPVQRYIDGLTSVHVPSRDGERNGDGNGKRKRERERERERERRRRTGTGAGDGELVRRVTGIGPSYWP